MKKIELVSPGGSFDKIGYAYHYGADAVYAGVADFSLRARMNDFTEVKLKKAVALARAKKKKIYFTLNIFAHEQHLMRLKKHLGFIGKVGPDAVIISDPGILNLAKKYAPSIPIHLSTQANTTNSEAVKFWKAQGVKRIVLAREVTFSEMKKIKKACPGMELECFVHGAMCMSLSGRCLLSKWMADRSANLGDCAQPCRWTYHVTRSMEHGTQEEEEKKIKLFEDQHGTYFMNSKDLCLIEYLNKLTEAGINAVKIEGRTKSAFYVATTARAYRRVIDSISKNLAEQKRAINAARKDLSRLVNRGYTAGFLFGKEKCEQNYSNSHEKSMFQFVGELMQANKKGELQKIRIHNCLKQGGKVFVMAPAGDYADEVLELINSKGEKVASAHGGHANEYFVRLKRPYPEKSLVMIKIVDN